MRLATANSAETVHPSRLRSGDMADSTPQRMAWFALVRLEDGE